jgi:hypothetical protein
VKGKVFSPTRWLLRTLHSWCVPGSAPVPERDVVSAKLERALEKSGCAICRLAREQEESYLYYFAWENVNDPQVRTRLRASFGFCSRHTWTLHDLEREWWGDGLESALVLDDVIHDVAVRLRAIRPGRQAALLQPRGACPACQLRQQAVATYLLWLVRHLARPEFRALYIGNGGICIPHLRECLSLNPDAATFLVDIALQLLDKAFEPRSLAGVVYGWNSIDNSTENRSVATNSSREVVEDPPCPACAWRLQYDPTAVLATCPWPARDESADWSAARGATGGLCHRHGVSLAELLDIPASHDAARSVLDEFGRATREWLLTTRAEVIRRRRDRARLPPGWLQALARGPARRDAPSSCLACQRVSASEKDFLWTTLSSTVARGQPHSQPFDLPVCLPHLRIALPLATDEQAAVLARNVAGRLEFLGGEVRDFIRKHGWDYRDEPRGPEQTSWIRATRFVAGERNAW